MFSFNEWAMLEPMKYYDKDRDSLSDALKKKYDIMIDNTDGNYMATRKYDGEWTMFIKWDGNVLIRSRALSKVTKSYGDKTAHLPHLVEAMQNWPNHTVILGEVCWPDTTTVSTDVGTILRCLPEKAVERQKTNPLCVKVFDILACNEVEYLKLPYEKRFTLATNLINRMNNRFFTMTEVCPDDMTPAEFADRIIAEGGEGAVIQKRSYVYEPGKRSAWQTLKLKQKLPAQEYKVIAAIDANRDYNGKYAENWDYWCFEEENHEVQVPIEYVRLHHQVVGEEYLTYSGMYCYPVSKPYYYNWKMGVRFECNGVICDASSGLTDEDREWLASEEAQKLIKDGHLYVTIRGMMVATLGAIRHPVILKLREMDAAMTEDKK